ncbi:PiggyBac transposable element-derived protein 4 [Eumeta japonica]|uniref:PiggyBac transposable element-derived protein 4 n=1 Tax=Eumeta variegata TaxID=151549 RepID=A0A4C1Y2X7_EUMVA|nr:PiggyBac transposable element-derived protein 4 [Eumeta japonica]
MPSQGALCLRLPMSTPCLTGPDAEPTFKKTKEKKSKYFFFQSRYGAILLSILSAARALDPRERVVLYDPPVTLYKYMGEDDLDLAAPTNFESEYEDSTSEHSSHRSDKETELDSLDRIEKQQIDEMLAAFRGKCFCRVYLKSKPAKYGLKIMCLCDAKTHYLYNAFIYSGKSTEPQNSEMSIPTQSVIAKPLFGSNRNITADNWFSSVQLVNQLKAKGLTYVGTLRKNKRELPKEFLPSKIRTEDDFVVVLTYVNSSSADSPWPGSSPPVEPHALNR